MSIICNSSGSSGTLSRWHIKVLTKDAAVERVSEAVLFARLNIDRLELEEREFDLVILLLVLEDGVAEIDIDLDDIGLEDEEIVSIVGPTDIEFDLLEVGVWRRGFEGVCSEFLLNDPVL